MLRIVMLLANARSDVMFAHYAVRRNIIHAVSITAEGNITCPQGQTSFSVNAPLRASRYCWGIFLLAKFWHNVNCCQPAFAQERLHKNCFSKTLSQTSKRKVLGNRCQGLVFFVEIISFKHVLKFLHPCHGACHCDAHKKPSNAKQGGEGNFAQKRQIFVVFAGKIVVLSAQSEVLERSDEPTNKGRK